MIDIETAQELFYNKIKYYYFDKIRENRGHNHVFDRYLQTNQRNLPDLEPA